MKDEQRKKCVGCEHWGEVKIAGSTSVITKNVSHVVDNGCMYDCKLIFTEVKPCGYVDMHLQRKRLEEKKHARANRRREEVR